MINIFLKVRPCYSCYWSLFFSFIACASPEVINGTSGLFSSFNYSAETPRNSICFWNITVPEGFVVKITFHAFSLSPADKNTDCTNAQGARLRISDVASTEQARDPFELCGQSIPSPVYTSTNTIQVRLKTPAQQGVTGFNASYEAISPDMCKSSYISSFIFLRRNETPVYMQLVIFAGVWWFGHFFGAVGNWFWNFLFKQQKTIKEGEVISSTLITCWISVPSSS